MRILIAADEIEISKARKAVLEHNRYSVDTVHSGTDALAPPNGRFFVLYMGFTVWAIGK